MKHDALSQDVTTKAQELGNDAKHAVRDKVESTVDELRDTAFDHATSAANAADAAAAEFDPDSIQARAAAQVADQVESLANQLRGADVNTITRDVSSFARNNPALFIAGAALLGFAATRFLKARDPQRVDPGFADADPWNTRPASAHGRGGFDVPS